MIDTCCRCSEPAVVQLPRGGRLCSGCATERIAHVDAEWSVLATELDVAEERIEELRYSLELEEKAVEREYDHGTEWQVFALRYRHERDEARAALDALETAIPWRIRAMAWKGAAKGWKARAHAAECERDEARAEAERLRAAACDHPCGVCLDPMPPVVGERPVAERSKKS